jgi:hypothetical protein
MKILLTEKPSENGYNQSLINAYTRAGHELTTGADAFFFSESLPDMVHIHWPESLFRWHAPRGMDSEQVSRLITGRLNWFKEHHVTIINTIHNLAPHDRAGTQDLDVYRQVIQHADILVHHCHNSVKLLTDSYPDILASKKNIVCAHGDYLIEYCSVSKAQARSRYNIPPDRQVILNFGRQRPYKNEKFIASVFSRLTSPSKYLVIAGIFDNPDNSRWLRIRNRFRKRFPYRDRKYIYRHFPSEELPDIITSADIIFLGQRHALNSGLLALAATYKIPVVCPDIGCFREAMENWHCEFYTAGDIDDAGRALQRMSEKIKHLENPDNSDWLAGNSWDHHVDMIIKALPG